MQMSWIWFAILDVAGALMVNKPSVSLCRMSLSRRNPSADMSRIAMAKLRTQQDGRISKAYTEECWLVVGRLDLVSLANMGVYRCEVSALGDNGPKSTLCGILAKADMGVQNRFSTQCHRGILIGSQRWPYSRVTNISKM
jgi:hypothetical protein